MSQPPNAPEPRAGLAWLRTAIDYVGAAAFLVGFFVSGKNLQAATWWLIAGSAAGLVASLAVFRRIAPLPAFYGGIALVFGTLTLVFHDTRFVKMKTTFIDGALGAGLLIGLVTGRSPIKLLMGSALQLPEAAWRRLTLRFGVFFLVCAAANEAIWRTQPDQTWILWRWPGLVIVTLAFAATQVPSLLKDARAQEAAAGLAEPQD